MPVRKETVMGRDVIIACDFNSKEEVINFLSKFEEDAKAMIVRGFAYPISKELPVEYAAEMNQLINLELEGSIG